MKATRVACLLGVVALLLATPGSAQTLVTVYEHDFETGVGPEWSHSTRGTIPVGGNQFLGRFGGQPVTLDLVDLPEHSMVTVSFDLYIIGDWEGSVGYHAGADLWGLRWTVPGDCCPGANLLYTTFANCSCGYQAYPEDYPYVHNPGQTGAAAVDSLGYADDAVYQLSFSFYHDEDELRLHFEGSPDLEDVSDESWALDNLLVQVDGAESGFCKAVRSLPEGYGAGHPATITVAADADAGGAAWVVRERPPARWSVTDVSHGGVVMGDAVVWGPFVDDQPRQLTYRVTPPAESGGTKVFRGTTTVAGEDEPVCGDAELAAGSLHPADTDGDGRVGVAELRAYGEAWRRATAWATGPNPVPIGLVTHAGLLWTAGGDYHFDPDASPPWTSDRRVEAAAPGSAAGSFDAVRWHPGAAVEVVLMVEPVRGTGTWALEDSPPAGWRVVSVDGGGVTDTGTGKVRWGPYLDDAARSLSYTVVPAQGARGEQSFAGLASFDGRTVAVQGERTLRPLAAARDGGHRRLRPE